LFFESVMSLIRRPDLCKPVLPAYVCSGASPNLRKTISPAYRVSESQCKPPPVDFIDLQRLAKPRQTSARRRHRLVRVRRSVFGLRKAASPTCTRPMFRFWPPQGGVTDLYASCAPF